MNLFDFTNIKSDVNPLGSALKPQNTGASMVSQPTGGGAMPPTPQAQPLEETPVDITKLDQEKIKSFIAYAKQKNIPKASVADALKNGINSGTFNKSAPIEAKPEPGVGSTLKGIGEKTATAFTAGLKSAGEGLSGAAKGIGSNIYQMTHGGEKATDIGRPLIEGLIGAGRAVTSPIEGVVSQGIEQVAAPVTSAITPDVVKDLAKEGFANAQEWYNSQSEPTKQLIKDTGLTAEGALNLLGVKASPKVAEAALKGSAASVEGLAQGAKLAGETIATGAEKTKNLLKIVPAEEKQASKILGETVEGLVDGKKVQIPKPSSTITEKITAPVRTSDTKVLAGRAIAPKANGMTPKQKISIVSNTEKNAKDLYNMVRTGKIKGNIDTLEDTAQTVVNGLDEVGGKIGEAVKGAKGTVTTNPSIIDEATRIFSNSVDMKAAAAPVLKDFIETTKNGLSIQDSFKAKKIFSTEIRKLSRAGDGGTDAYSALVKGVHELDGAIDNAVNATLKGAQHAELKSQYATLKKLAADIVQSAMVESRRAPQTLAEQMGMLQTISDIIKNPLSGTYRATAGALVKDMAELNTRGGSWKEFVKIMDKQAIKSAKSAPLKPSTIIKKPLQSKPLINAKTTEKVPVGNAQVPLKDGASKPKSLQSVMRSKGGFIKLPGKAESAGKVYSPEGAIKTYTNSSDKINAMLRSGKTTPQIEALDKFLSGADTHKGIVYRGITVPEGKYESIIADIKNNGISDNAYISSSKNYGDATTYSKTSKSAGTKGIMFEIESKNGKIIEPKYNAYNEEEILFPRGTKFKYSGEYKDAGRGTIIQLVEI